MLSCANIMLKYYF